MTENADMTILLNGPVARRGVDFVQRYFDGEVPLDEITGEESEEHRIKKFAAAEILVTVNFGADLPPSPKLKLIHLPASGLDLIDFGAIPSGCKVCNAFEHEVGISEYVMSAMLHFTTRLEQRSARFKTGDWQDTPQLFADFAPNSQAKRWDASVMAP
ncbi:MAG: hypothetical protein ACR2Q4_21525 [Geminicoccaceae bacterium]